MNSSGSLFLGWRYLRRQKAKALLLTGALTLAIFLPIGVTLFVQEAEDRLRNRAESTPLLLGAPGSSLELIFNGLYFTYPDINPLRNGEIESIKKDGLARVIPIHSRFSAKSHRIIGTTIDYFRFRDLKTAEGRQLSRLGECVIGSAVASELNLGPGDFLISAPEAVFDLAGVYPLKMRITGVLERSGEADDRAVFVDVRTAWIIAGLAHGHENATDADASEILNREESGTVVLNASVVEYTEITEENADSFHFHGDPADYPLTAAIVIPEDQKSKTILLGRFQDHESLQLAIPDVVMAELFETVFKVRSLVVSALVAVAAATLLIALIVFLLSNRLRLREFESLWKIGADRGTIRLLILFEGITVVLASLIAAGILTGLLKLAAPFLVRLLTG